MNFARSKNPQSTRSWTCARNAERVNAEKMVSVARTVTTPPPMLIPSCHEPPIYRTLSPSEISRQIIRNRRLTLVFISSYVATPWNMVLIAAIFRFLMIPPFVPFLGVPGDHFKGNEPSQIAAHLIRGDGYASPYTAHAIATAQQPPLYPVLITGIFALFGTFSNASLYAIMCLNGIIGSIVTFLIYRAGCKFFSASVGLIAGWTWALLPTIAITDVTLTGYPLMALAVMLWLNYIPELAPNIRNWLLLGCGIGGMLLLNPMLVLLVPASAFWFYRRQTLLMAAAALIIVAPWYVRNYRVMGRIYPGLRSNLGMELYIGNHVGSGLGDWRTESAYSSEQYVKNGEAEFFEARKREAVGFIRSEPASFALRCIKRCVVFWLHPSLIVHAMLLALSLLGIALASRAMRTFTATLFLFYPLAFYVTQVSWPTAYRHPIESLMVLMAASAMQTIRHWVGL